MDMNNEHRIYGPEDLHRVLEHLDAMRESDLGLLMELTAQPSVSARDMGVKECTELLCRILRDAGCTRAEVFPTQGQPVVYGEMPSSDASAPTVLFYGHYDTQPADPEEEWLTPPWTPTLKDGRLYGLGTADNKGQLLAHILATRSWLSAAGGLPVNVKFILDGEEESGSPSMADFALAHKDLLKADLVYNSDGPMSPGEFPEIKMGSRGDLSAEIELVTATHQNHSKTGQLIPNPAIELCRLIASMIDGDGNVLIEGFYDQVPPMTDYERQLVEELDFDPEKLAAIYGTKTLMKKDKQSYYEQLMFKPTLTVNGMCSGYYGEGHKTCVPRSALAKLDIRLVKGMDPGDVAEKLRRHAARFCPEARVIIRDQPMLPSRTSAELPICQAVFEGVRAVYPKAVIHPSSGGSTPGYVWTELLKMPCVLVPYGNSDQTNHSPNENLKLSCYWAGIRVSAEVMYRIGAMDRQTSR